MPSNHFKLASHVRARQVDDQVILLDLRRGKYVGVAARPLALLDPAIEGLSVDVTVTDAPTRRPDGSRLMASLRSQGLITDKAATRSAAVALEEALRSMNPRTTPQTPASPAPVYPAFSLAARLPPFP